MFTTELVANPCLSSSPTLLFFSRSQRLAVPRGAAASAAELNIILATRNEAILTTLLH